MADKKFKSNAEAYVDGSRTLEPKYYTSQEIFEIEKERIFQRYWLCLGHESGLNEGTYRLQNVVGNNLIVLKDHQGMVRVFYNTCRHRNTLLCEEPEGKLKHSIQCQYHQWTYNLDGKLRLPKIMEGVREFKAEENGLLAVPLHIQNGFMFINLTEDDPEPFEEQYAPMVPKFREWSGQNLKVVHSVTATLRINYKLAVTNFHECGHCAKNHKLFNSFVDATAAAHDLTEGPFLGGYMNILNGESITMTRKLCALPLSPAEAKGASRGWYYGAPNTLWNKHRDYIMVHHLFPTSPTETMIVTEWLFNANAVGRKDFDPQQAIEAWSITNAEDWGLCQLNQLGMESGAKEPGWHAPNESLLMAYDNWIREETGNLMR